MSYMKWIYSMIVDNTYPEFKEKYKQSLKDNKEEFIWDAHPININFAKYVCILVDKHLLQEYDKHLEQEAIKHQAYIDDPINY